MNLYECITILDAGLNDDAINEAIEKIQGIITKGGGEILKTDQWGRRKLAYEINHHSRGYYVLFVYHAPSDVNRKMEDTFKVYDPVIKFMLMRLDKKQASGTLKALEAEKAAKAAAEAAPAAAAAPAPAEAEAKEAAPEAPVAEKTEAPADSTEQE